MSLRHVLCGMLLVVLVLSGCEKRTAVTAAEQPDTASSNPVGVDNPNRNVAVLPGPAQLNHGFPAGDLRSFVSPRDFEIGELSVAELPEELQLLANFCEDLGRGTVSPENLAPGRRAILRPGLESRMADGAIPQRYRVGNREASDNRQISARVRLFGRIGHATGRIYLVRILGEWYVDDVQLDLAQLLQVSPGREGRYYPEMYGDLFKGL